MNLHHLFVFCVVAENRSFIASAEELNISQPAVSQLVHKLESSVGRKLIERNGRAFRLTGYGEILLDYGKRIFSMVEEAENALVRVSRHQEKLFIGTSTIPGTYFLSDFVSGFREQNPYMSLNIFFEDNNLELIEKLIKNQIDIAITYESVILRDDIQVRRITEDELILVLPGKHPWATGRMISFEEVITLPFIFYNPGYFIQQIMESILSGSRVNVFMHLGNLEAVKAAIIRGLGVSMLPYSSIRFELEHGLLAVANCSIFRVPRHLVLMNKTSFIGSDLINRFINYLLSKDKTLQMDV